MADVPVAEGGRPGGGGGSHWLAIGAVAGVGTLLFLMFKGSGGPQGTTAAGTSINAALGSIQEQNLNIMGEIGAAQNALSTQMSDYNTSQLAAMSGMQDALSKQMGGIDQHITDSTNQLSGQLTDVNGNVIANGQSMGYWFPYLSGQVAGTSAQLTQANGALEGISGAIGGLPGWMQQYFVPILDRVTSIQNSNLSQGVSGSIQYLLAPLNVQPKEVQKNYLNRYGSYDNANNAFLNDYLSNPYHGGFITGQGTWSPLTFWDSTLK